MEWVYSITTSERPQLTQVGGKAMSLISMTRGGLPVPPGFVLTVAFFALWLEQVQRTPEWSRVLSSADGDLKRNCDAVKARAMVLELDEAHREALAEALASLQASDGASLLAVRSSSPEEDRELDSFAGAYETVLGVRPDEIESAVRRAFASCLDERVLVYKQEHGFEVDKPRIAVIVQQQIAADKAGVAFSLNPLNNCYDEAVINANFGLGESVVSGAVLPDSFIVDKGSRTILDRKVGSKESSTWLAADGGTYEKPSPSRERSCLSDDEVLALTDLLVKVENHYGRPIDVEWAFAKGRSYLLQARSITAYIPLAEAMVTAPGEPKHLYLDLTLLKWGMHDLLSVMGMDYMAIANAAMLKMTMGPDTGPDVVAAVRPTHGGRVYVDASISMKMQGVKRLVESFRVMDSISAEIIDHIDPAEYMSIQLPPSMRWSTLKMIRLNLGTVWQGLAALKRPAESRARYLEAEGQMYKGLAGLADAGQRMSMREFAKSTMESMIVHMRTFFPLIIAVEIVKSGLKKLFKNDEPEIRDQVPYLERALPNNVTIEMGLDMYRLSNYDEVRECASSQEFVVRLEGRAFSPAFLQAWDTFMAKYGCRTPMEMDPATPRFYEQPAQVYAQLRTMAESADAEHNPQAILNRATARREEAYRVLLEAVQRKGKRQAQRFIRYYSVLMECAGYREAPKYLFVVLTDMFRRQVLARARSLVEAGRLDHPNQAFDLTMDQFDRATRDPALDLRALAAENTRSLERLERVRELPRLIDSRGKILRLPIVQAQEGELAGDPISPGVVRGPVKVLREPDEKPVLPGEILVTRATDPGWTPLFLNASGIILEVGGMLQHGALVAREYGKPCVSGLENATEILRDGQIIELDGTNGIVRLAAVV